VSPRVTPEASIPLAAPHTPPIPLTSLSHGAGCGCKLPAAALHPIVAGLPRPDRADVLVAAETADDAGVIRISDEIALVQTVDFFTPIVDDPYAFGRIAAVNALSDVYAMGGKPLSALNLVAFPLEQLGPDVLREILRGGQDAVIEAGAALIGGHSIDDPEPKYGLAVTGTVHPDRILTNAGGQAGDLLTLSKPLGVGAISTAAKRGHVSDELIAASIEVMGTLNRDAALAAIEAGAHALTDVTGFGLLGHLHELAKASGCAAEIDSAAVPEIEGVRFEDGWVAGGTRRNRDYAETFTTFADAVDEHRRWLVCDATTSGGLLAAGPKPAAGPVIGRLVEGEPGTIHVA
jgi:selenide,water dikinase